MGVQPDANGTVTRAAAIAAADQRFAAMDANHDGTVTPTRCVPTASSAVPNTPRAASVATAQAETGPLARAAAHDRRRLPRPRHRHVRSARHQS